MDQAVAATIPLTTIASGRLRRRSAWISPVTSTGRLLAPLSTDWYRPGASRVARAEHERRLALGSASDQLGPGPDSVGVAVRSEHGELGADRGVATKLEIASPEHQTVAIVMAPEGHASPDGPRLSGHAVRPPRHVGRRDAPRSWAGRRWSPRPSRRCGRGAAAEPSPATGPARSRPNGRPAHDSRMGAGAEAQPVVGRDDDRASGRRRLCFFRRSTRRPSIRSTSAVCKR